MDTLLASIIIAILLGISPIVHRVVSQKVSKGFILLISAVTYLIAVIMYVWFTAAKKVYTDFTLHKVYILPLAITTLFGLFFTNVLYLYVMKHTTNVNVAVIIMAMYPVVTLILAYFLLKEGLSPLGLIGFFMVVVGIALLLHSKK